MDDATDPELARIAEAMEQQNKKRADFGRLLGLDSAQVTRTFAGRRRLQLHEYNRVMEWLGLVPPPQRSSGGAVVAMPGLVPLYGLVGAASDSRLTFAEQNLRGYVPMHPNQVNIRDAFALEVADVSMAPRYEPGEIVYIAPNRFPRAGQDCVAVTVDGEGLLKQFIKRSLDAITFHQFNPERTFTIELVKLHVVHSVVGRG
jgi:phage repressor protein C with HTH and peptisase S24 domain